VDRRLLEAQAAALGFVFTEVRPAGPASPGLGGPAWS
jgi:hypothetical protein